MTEESKKALLNKISQKVTRLAGKDIGTLSTPDLFYLHTFMKNYLYRSETFEVVKASSREDKILHGVAKNLAQERHAENTGEEYGVLLNETNLEIAQRISTAEAKIRPNKEDRIVKNLSNLASTVDLFTKFRENEHKEIVMSISYLNVYLRGLIGGENTLNVALEKLESVPNKEEIAEDIYKASFNFQELEDEGTSDSMRDFVYFNVIYPLEERINLQAFYEVLSESKYLSIFNFMTFMYENLTHNKMAQDYNENVNHLLSQIKHKPSKRLLVASNSFPTFSMEELYPTKDRIRVAVDEVKLLDEAFSFETVNFFDYYGPILHILRTNN